MHVIHSAVKLAAIAGGDGDGSSGVDRTVDASGQFDGSDNLGTMDNFAFELFDIVEDLGADFGSWLYDVTHSY